jgi:hypothetical protein
MAALVVFILSLVAGLWLTSRPHQFVAHAATCTPSAVTDPMDVVVTPKTDVQAWDRLRVEFSGAISDGHCAGDSFSVQIPPQLHPAEGSSYPLRAPDGSLVAMMTVHGGRITVTLTDYVETHQGVTLEGWLQAQIDNTTRAGDTAELSWDVNGKITKTPVQMGPCPNCTVLPTKPAKWGSQRADGTLQIVIQSAPTASDDEQVSFTDTLTSPGQRFECPVPVTTRQYTRLGPWGDPIDSGLGPNVTVTDCTELSVSGTLQVASAGTVVRIYLTVQVSDHSVASWTDTARVTQAGKRTDVHTTVVSFSGGGSGGGTTPPASPTSTAPSSTPSSSPPSSSSPSSSPVSASTTPRATTSDRTSIDASQTSRSPLASTGGHSRGIAAFAVAALALGAVILRLGRRPAPRH